MQDLHLSPYTTITVKNGNAVLPAVGTLAGLDIGERATLLVQAKPNRELDAFDAEFERMTTEIDPDSRDIVTIANTLYLRYAMKRAVDALEDGSISPFARDGLIQIRNMCDHILRTVWLMDVGFYSLRTFPGESWGTQQTAVYRVYIRPRSGENFVGYFTDTSFKEFFNS